MALILRLALVSVILRIEEMMIDEPHQEQQQQQQHYGLSIWKRNPNQSYVKDTTEEEEEEDKPPSYEEACRNYGFVNPRQHTQINEDLLDHPTPKTQIAKEIPSTNHTNNPKTITSDEEHRPRTSEATAMGQRPSGYRRSSKVSLTWVLSNNSSSVSSSSGAFHHMNHNKQQHPQQQLPQPYRSSEDRRSEGRRVAGRSEGKVSARHHRGYYVDEEDDDDDEEGGCEDCDRRSRREEHRRRRRRRRPKQREQSREEQQSKEGQRAYFGYQIEDIDRFLEEASLDRPGNIPVVVVRSSVLYQTDGGRGQQRELELPLGAVVNAVFRNERWLYVRTPHAHEGYVLGEACVPLGILPSTRSKPKSPPPTPALLASSHRWESHAELRGGGGGNLTDCEKELGTRRAKSECGGARPFAMSSKCGERAFDGLYLRSTSRIGRTKIVDDPEDDEPLFCKDPSAISAIVKGSLDEELLRAGYYGYL